MPSDFYTYEELKRIDFKTIGNNIQISRSCIFFNPHLISMGNNIRIDANCVISANHEPVNFGSYIHIGVGCYINGSFGIDLKDFCGLASGVRLFSSSDDYSGEFMTNPTVPEDLTSPFNSKVVINKYVNVGSNSVIFPGVNIGEGSTIGALSLVNKSLKSWGVYFGSPVIRISDRKKNVIDLSKKITDS
jgi:dTDP-4-amino-4,6-dideoxy-D-glucose acyltransferase